MKFIVTSFLIAKASVSAPLALASGSRHEGHLLLQSRGVGMGCSSDNECTSFYCTENNSGQQGICVSYQEVVSKAIDPRAWSERFNNINMAGCHNCYEPKYADGHGTFRSVVRGIPALELDVFKCDDDWVVAHDGCDAADGFFRLLRDYLSDIKMTLEDDLYQFPIVVNIDFKGIGLVGQGGCGEEMNDILSSTLGFYVFTKNDLAAYNGLSVDTDFDNPSWDMFRSMALSRDNFWPKPMDDVLRNKVIFVANHIFNEELGDVREFNNFFLAPSFIKDSNIDGDITTISPFFSYKAEGQTVFGNLAQNGQPQYVNGGIGGKCQGDLPNLLKGARVISRCWDGDNPDTFPITVQWTNGVSVGTNHDVEGQSLQYKIQASESIRAGGPGFSCNSDSDCDNSLCVLDNCHTGASGDICEYDSDCDGRCGRGICSDGETGALCGHDGDCANGRCVYDICRAGVSGDPCEGDSDCNGLCGRNICSDGNTGAACGHDGDCANGRCVYDICRAGVSGDPCEGDSDCNGVCGRNICSDGETGAACGHDEDCANGRCVSDKCRAGVSGDPCEYDSDCNSGKCSCSGLFCSCSIWTSCVC